MKYIERIKRKFYGLYAKKNVNLSVEEANELLETLHPDIRANAYLKNAVVKDDPGCMLSVIITTYNNEDLIAECVESVVSQSTEYSFEVIVIDDGSKDLTKKKLSQYVKTEKIKYIYQENRGHSGARNTGIFLANGKYYMFVDSDDRLKKDAIQGLVSIAERYKAEIVVGDYDVLVGNKVTPNVMKYDSVRECYQEELYGQPWGKIYRREVFDYIRFPEGYWYEDSIFAQLVWPKYRKIYCTPASVYMYYINPNGVTQKSKNNIRSLESLYITRNLLRERHEMGEVFTKNDCEYFLKMIKLTAKRTNNLPNDVQEAVFVLQASMYEEYFMSFEKEMTGINKELAEALICRRYKEYLKYCNR